jgi:hypothetical protein
MSFASLLAASSMSRHVLSTVAARSSQTGSCWVTATLTLLAIFDLPNYKIAQDLLLTGEYIECPH